MLATLDVNSFQYMFHMNILQHPDYFMDFMVKMNGLTAADVMKECIDEADPRVNNLVIYIDSRDIANVNRVIDRIRRALTIVYNIQVDKSDPRTIKDMGLLEGIQNPLFGIIRELCALPVNSISLGDMDNIISKYTYTTTAHPKDPTVE